MNCVLHVWVLAQSRAKKYCHIPIFKNHSWQKCPNPAYFIMKTPLYCLTPPFFLDFVQPPLSCRRKPLPPLLFLLSCFFDQMSDRATFDVIFCWMILWIHTYQTLVPQYQKDLDVCFMQQGVKFTEVWHMWFFAGTLIWYHTHTNTQTHSTFRGQ